MNSNSEITEYTRNVIQRLANKYVVVPTTGRGFYKLREEILKVEPLDIRKEKISKITRKDIIRASKKIDMDTVFLLEGGNE